MRRVVFEFWWEDNGLMGKLAEEAFVKLLRDLVKTSNNKELAAHIVSAKG